jgi:hypothetical protein
MQIDQVFDEYWKGDADKRMSLFLYHRELRDEFTRIDHESPVNLPKAPLAEPIRYNMVQRMLILLRKGCRIRSRAHEASGQ